MSIQHALALSAAALAISLATPASAQPTANSANSTNSTNIRFADSSGSGASGNIVVVQELTAIVTNSGVGANVNASLASGHSRTGDTIIAGDAFVTFGGVLTQSFNTGVNSNVQAATNIAVSGSFAARSF